MSQSAIRLLTIVLSAAAIVAIPVITPAKAITDGRPSVKKKQKSISPARNEAHRPGTSSQYPPNMSDDPSRKISY